MFFGIIFAIAFAFAHIFFRPAFSGRENIPEGSTLVCCNHTSNLDPVFLYLAMGKKLHLRFMAKKELFGIPVFSAAIKALGAFPVDREGADVGSLKTSLRILSSEGKLVIFPEGQRIVRGKTSEARAGAGMLAMRSGCKVLPVYIEEEKRLFGRVRVVIGEPFEVAKPEGKHSSEAYRAAAEDILRRIFELKVEK